MDDILECIDNFLEKLELEDNNQSLVLSISIFIYKCVEDVIWLL